MALPSRLAETMIRILADVQELRRKVETSGRHDALLLALGRIAAQAEIVLTLVDEEDRPVQ